MIKLIPIGFKSEKIKEEFLSGKFNDKLRNILFFIGGYCKAKFNKNIIITEIYREQETQNLYYKDDALYKKKPWLSVHQCWRGADVRVFGFTEEEKNDIEFVVNLHFKYSKRNNKKTCLVHELTPGLKLHFHFQVDY